MRSRARHGICSFGGALLGLLFASAAIAVGPCPADGDCCTDNGTPGCDDAACCAAVCKADPFCCDVAWDGICADGALNSPDCKCDGGGGPCPGEGDCCSANGTPGCDNGACCEAVCKADPFCCDTAWDQICADGAAKLCDGCGGGGGPCPGEGDCCSANGTPGCDNAACCEAVCQADPFCCDTAWDQICADGAAKLCDGCGGGGGPCPGEGDCCSANGTPGCDNATCCEAVCEADPFCCDVAWDGICADAATKICDGCGGGGGPCPGDGDCCIANGSPGCDNASCCEAVCAEDPFCCDVEWDQICADLATELCDGCGGGGGPCPGDGDCCVDNGTPGCDNAFCCETVCAEDPFCCDVAWDGICADLASELCDGCGGGGGPCPGDGDCCAANDSPGCDDATCCEAVCADDPFCCDVSWDGICADGAANNPACDCDGGPCPGGGDCCEANDSPGCDDAACCESVCAADPFCCDVSWDAICAGAAADDPNCDCGAGPCPGDGDCCAEDGNGTPGCNDEECCEIVCTLDQFCCDVSWDGLCAAQANDVCTVCETGGQPFFDIKPGSCPNPLNAGSQGYTPMAILGTADFDVNMIDVNSVIVTRADGVGTFATPNFGPPGPSPKIGDAGTPFESDMVCGCHGAGPDGIDDLKIKVSTPQLAENLELGDVESGSFVELVVSGSLIDGTPFEASDCIKIVP